MICCKLAASVHLQGSKNRGYQQDSGTRAQLFRPCVDELGDPLRCGARCIRTSLGALVSRCEASLPRGDLGLHCLTRDGRDPTLALDVLTNLGGFRLRAASRSGLRPGARWGAPRGRTDLVRAVSGAPRGAAVRRSPVHAGRLPAGWDVGGVLTCPPLGSGSAFEGHRPFSFRPAPTAVSAQVTGLRPFASPHS